MRGLERFAPLTGVLFVVLVVVAVIVGGESPSPDDSLRTVLEYFRDDQDSAIAASIIAAISAVPLIWFAGTLRAAVTVAEGPPGRLASTAWGGAVVMTVGWLALAAFTFVAADTSDDVVPQVTWTLSTLQADFFFPVAIGSVVFLLANGVAILRTGVFPAWLGWVAIVLGIVGLTPVGFFAVLAMLVWILVVSVMLFQRTPATPPAPQL